MGVLLQGMDEKERVIINDSRDVPQSEQMMVPTVTDHLVGRIVTHAGLLGNEFWVFCGDRVVHLSVLKLGKGIGAVQARCGDWEGGAHLIAEWDRFHVNNPLIRRTLAGATFQRATQWGGGMFLYFRDPQQRELVLSIMLMPTGELVDAGVCRTCTRGVCVFSDSTHVEHCCARCAGTEGREHHEQCTRIWELWMRAAVERAASK